MDNKKIALTQAIEILKEAARGGATFTYATALESLYKKIVELREDSQK